MNLISLSRLKSLSQSVRQKVCITRQRISLKMPFIPTELVCLREYDPRQFFVFDKQHLVYLEVPKVASTSILFTISKYYDVELTRPINNQYSFLQKQRKKLRKNHANYYTFSFIRNPFDRLVSCYKNKILRPYNLKKPTYHLLSAEGSHHNLRFGVGKCHSPHYLSLLENPSFANFVKIIADIPDFMANRHFKSQYAILYDKNRLLVDWIGRFENLASDWAELASRFKLSKVLYKKNFTQPKNLVICDYRLYYTEELAKMVYNRYQKDVDLLGYSHAYEDLLDFIET